MDCIFLFFLTRYGSRRIFFFFNNVTHCCYFRKPRHATNFTEEQCIFSFGSLLRAWKVTTLSPVLPPPSYTDPIIPGRLNEGNVEPPLWYASHPLANMHPSILNLWQRRRLVLPCPRVNVLDFDGGSCWLFMTPWTAACQAPLSSTNFQFVRIPIHCTWIYNRGSQSVCRDALGQYLSTVV